MMGERNGGFNPGKMAERDDYNGEVLKYKTDAEVDKNATLQMYEAKKTREAAKEMGITAGTLGEERELFERTATKIHEEAIEDNFDKAAAAEKAFFNKSMRKGDPETAEEAEAERQALRKVLDDKEMAHTLLEDASMAEE